jgi:hypothetical protein
MKRECDLARQDTESRKRQEALLVGEGMEQ